MAAITFDERKTNARAGVRAQHRHARFSAYKARQVLDLIRNKSVAEARTILEFSDRAAAETVLKVLDSAVANAANNNDIPPEELFVSACYADEGPTMKRWRPRARGRATRIRKRTCHITVIVGRYSPDELDKIRQRLAGKGRSTTDAASARARRVARSRGGASATEAPDASEPDDEELAETTEEVVGEQFAEQVEGDLDEQLEEAEQAAQAAEAEATDADDAATDADDEATDADDETAKKDD
jgi:large subunit ribosomal protein L22